MLRKLLYKFPIMVSAYHFLWAFTGRIIYGNPSKKLFVIGITGTKGKTTAVDLLDAVLAAAGKKTAVLSSLRIKIGEENHKNLMGNSMPGRFFLQKFLRDAAMSGCQYAIIEVTSQGVVQSRHRFIDWNMGVLTNLAPEHIEAHGSFEKYRDAKLSFLKYVAQKGGRVFLNKDDKRADYFADALQSTHPMLYSKDDAARTLQRMQSPGSVVFGSGSSFFDSDFNKENLAAVLSVARELGIQEAAIQKAISGFRGVPGRMEYVQRQPFAVVVDYAHTAESLEAIYKATKPARGRLICVLGAAGGGRDKWKRPEMGAVAAKYCDEIILTDEDPYDENPAEITNEIKEGVLHAREDARIEEILNRREAIEEAISRAEEGDAVVMTGKGSEQWIHAARGKKIPWNEREVAEETLKNRHY